MSFPMLSAGVMNSVFFGVYGSTLRMMESWGLATTENPSLTAVFAAGCMGGLGQVGIACPVDLVKIKLQAQTGIFTIFLKSLIQ
jgi:solute carrier family 25 protein 45/47